MGGGMGGKRRKYNSFIYSNKNLLYIDTWILCIFMYSVALIIKKFKVICRPKYLLSMMVF
jgi:hypothetical protein